MARAALACTRGTSSVEFALLVPVLLSLLAGAAEFAILFTTHSQLTDIARQVTRRVATGSLADSAAVELARSRVGDVTKAKPEIEVKETALSGGAGTDVTVTLTVPLGDVMLFDLWPVGASRLTASATMPKE